MDAKIPLLVIDRKVFWVMSTYYQTYGVTRLRIIDLLGTGSVRSTREIHLKYSEKIENVSERNRKGFGENWKSFRKPRKSWRTLKGTGRSKKVLEYFGTF
jgi:hypothetical protein